jgi:hypothetical protein
MADRHSRLLRYLQFAGHLCLFVSLFPYTSRAAITLHGGDLIDNAQRKGQCGAQHGARLWVNATFPVIATFGLCHFAEVDFQDTRACPAGYAREGPSPHESIWQRISTAARTVTLDLRGLL